MLLSLVLLLGIVFVAACVTAIAFVTVIYMSRNKGLAIVLAGLAFPLLFVVGGTLDLMFFDQDVDGPPPGMVLLGLMALSAILLPITFGMSLWLARRYSGQADR